MEDRDDEKITLKTINLERARYALDDFGPRAACYDYYIQSVPAAKMAEAVAYAAGFQETDKVLDLACGTGFLLKHLPGDGLRCGLDLCKAMLLKAGGNHFHRVQAHACALPFRDETFDVVVCLGAINIFDDNELGLLLREIIRTLNKRGCFVADASILPHPSTLDRLLHPLLRTYNHLISTAWRCPVTIQYHKRDIDQLGTIFENHFEEVETFMRNDLIRIGMGVKYGIGIVVGRK
ncbi:MAG: class I SAM-dependent methyltransferase [Methanotrichaceae archaeon]